MRLCIMLKGGGSRQEIYGGPILGAVLMDVRSPSGARRMSSSRHPSLSSLSSDFQVGVSGLLIYPRLFSPTSLGVAFTGFTPSVGCAVDWGLRRAVWGTGRVLQALSHPAYWHPAKPTQSPVYRSPGPATLGETQR